jgi:hypothetical protein
LYDLDTVIDQRGEHGNYHAVLMYQLLHQSLELSKEGLEGGKVFFSRFGFRRNYTSVGAARLL